MERILNLTPDFQKITLSHMLSNWLLRSHNKNQLESFSAPQLFFLNADGRLKSTSYSYVNLGQSQKTNTNPKGEHTDQCCKVFVEK